MKRNVYDVLQERGYIEQATHPEEIRELLGKESVTFYIGFDATADSLHVGHFLQIMVMMHMQRAGHRPIALMGGGTTMVGDPSGKTDMRKMLTVEDIAHNVQEFQRQISKFIDFSDGKALMLNNGDWLMHLNYIELLRDVGVHFSVNRMMTFENIKSRMERGLTFLEFNYMIMQSYDFYHLFKEYGCKLQLGGNDQWSNILGGVELVRRKTGGEAFGLTFKLLTNSEGKKMGKTESGALWLDPNKTSPYEFYQYWRNVDDADVINCLRLLTFLPLEEIDALSKLEGKELNKAKEILAYEVTKLVHSEEDAKKSQEAARALFGGGGDSANMPFTEISKEAFGEGMDILSLLKEAGLAASNSEGRRLVEQGGIAVDNEKVASIQQVITPDQFQEDKIIIRKGKKVYHQIRLV